MVWRRKCRVLFILLILVAFAKAPDAHGQVSEADWMEIIEGVDYGKQKKEEPEEKEEKEDKDKEDTSGFDWNPGPMINWGSGGAQIFGWSLLGLLALGLIFLLLKVIIQGSGDTRIGDGEENIIYMLDDIEENLHESDLEKALRLALEQRNFKAAIRIYYLAIIKECSSRKLIRWKKEKTNHQYLIELSPTPFFTDFKKVTLTFEQAWYGDQEINQIHFEAIKPSFQKLLNKISSDE